MYKFAMRYAVPVVTGGLVAFWLYAAIDAYHVRLWHRWGHAPYIATIVNRSPVQKIPVFGVISDGMDTLTGRLDTLKLAPPPGGASLKPIKAYLSTDMAVGAKLKFFINKNTGELSGDPDSYPYNPYAPVIVGLLVSGLTALAIYITAAELAFVRRHRSQYTSELY